MREATREGGELKKRREEITERMSGKQFCLCLESL